MSWKNETKNLSLRKSHIIADMPKACASEAAAVEFLEAQRWNGTPACVRCGSMDIYKMASASGGRSSRFLWRCKDCPKGKDQFTVRVGTIFEDSKIPLWKWCLGFWLCAAAKNGLSALELSRDLQVTHKTALFVLHRIRYAMAPDHAVSPKLGTQPDAIIEADETYVGGKPRNRKLDKRFAKMPKKTPVFAVLERGGQVRARVMASVTSENLKEALLECASTTAVLNTDELPAYLRAGREFRAHDSVNHSKKQYKKYATTTNTVESFFANLKRGIFGTYHNVSKKHLHRYVSEFEFRYNARKLNDGERLVLIIKQAEGKRLMYREPIEVPEVVLPNPQDAPFRPRRLLTYNPHDLR